MKTTKAVISGTVQGIFFRKFIEEEARKLGLKGFARNLDDGRVEVFVEGRDENVNELVEKCRKGPLHSQVDKVKTEEIKHQGFDEFKILRI